MQNIRTSLDDLLRNLLLSHIVVREMPGNNNNKTLIRIHLIPLPGSISNANVSANINSVLYPKNVVKQKRNTHVSHLPKYRKVTNDMLDVSCTSKQLSSDICSICRCQFKCGEYFRKLPICNHIYHKKCIDKWFTKDDKHMKCPNCRTSHTKEKVDEFNLAKVVQNMEVVN
jgi:hypothetical protein